MIKRRLGSALQARSYWTQCREIILRVISHNVMIVAKVRIFDRVGRTSFGLLGASVRDAGGPSGDHTGAGQ